MLDFERNFHHPFYFEKNYKTVEQNVGCKVPHPMETKQPTSRDNSIQTEKPFENVSSELQLVINALQKCSKDTRTEAAEKILEELDEVEN